MLRGAFHAIIKCCMCLRALIIQWFISLFCFSCRLVLFSFFFMKEQSLSNCWEMHFIQCLRCFCVCVCVLAHLEFNGVSHSFALIWRLVLLCHEGIISNYWEMLFIQCLKCVWALRIQWFISLVAFSWIPVSLSLGCFVIKEGIYLYFSKISLLR